MNNKLYLKLKKQIPLSVALTTHIDEKVEYFEQSLNSVCQQTFYPDEIVICIDGETNKFEKAIKNIPDVIDVKVLLNKERVYSPWLGCKKTVLESKNELIARMDSDDISCENRFEKQYNFLKSHQEIDVVGAYIVEFKENYSTEYINRIRKVPTDHEDIVADLQYKQTINHVTAMYKKSSILNAGNYRKKFRFNDYDLWYRMALNGARFHNLPESLVKVRIGNDMVGRRIGYTYAKEEYDHFMNMYKDKFINFNQLLFNLAIRIPIRFLPKNILSSLYNILRKFQS